MEFRTKIDIPVSVKKIQPCERMLFVGSCFADNIGKRFQEEKFRAVVNPYGVMYNPASVLHTVEKYIASTDIMPTTTVITLGTNHVYREIATGEIVDNCQKRPQNLFQEEILSVEECYTHLKHAIDILLPCPERGKERAIGSGKGAVILTISPIRYRKYGYHESQLSKATLLLAADRLVKEYPGQVSYFPAYEIVNDELRDYRFYQPDMLHPSQQAVDYIYERFAETWFSDETNKFLSAWRPLKEALGHRAFNPESAEYKAFLAATMKKVEALKQQYPEME